MTSMVHFRSIPTLDFQVSLNRGETAPLKVAISITLTVTLILGMLSVMLISPHKEQPMQLRLRYLNFHAAPVAIQKPAQLVFGEPDFS